MKLDLFKIRKIYFIGIKGVALSGLAIICKQKGMEVFGSDVADKFITDKILAENKIEFFEEFSASNLKVKPDLVVVGASWDNSNVEVAAAKAGKLKVITDSELRGILSQEKSTIAITGVHGKTTTTAILSYVFTQAGLDPSYLIGTGKVADLGTNATWQKSGQHFIVEGDEYVRSHSDHVPKFLDLEPDISVITSIEWEHVDVFPNVEALETAFAQLAKKTKGTVIAAGDWPSVQKAVSHVKDKTITYGLDSANDYQTYDIVEEFEQTSFKIRHGQEDLGQFQISLFGPHNALNATAVVIVSLTVGLKLGQIKESIKKFKGAERRFDVSERGGIIFVDDYGHHPTEIATTLKAVRHRYTHKKIWCVFQPHMASRTKAFLDELARSFSACDVVLFADIFASAREKDMDVSSRQLETQAKQYHPQAVYTGDLDQTVEYLKNNLPDNVVLVTMGAGDVYRVRDQIIDHQE